MEEYKHKLDVLHNLPYTTVKIFDGEKVVQRLVVMYSDVIDEMKKSRKALLKDKKWYYKGKIKNIKRK
jgi:hypothetical protein